MKSTSNHVPQRARILFVLHLPPPIHGVSQINTIIKESQCINGAFDCDYMNLATANRISDFGKHRIGKYFRILKLILLFIKKNLACSYDLIYITPSIPGVGFYKDSVFIFLGKLFRRKIVCHLHVQGFKKAAMSPVKEKYYSCVFKNIFVIHLSSSLYVDISDFVKISNVFFVENGIKAVSTKELMRTERSQKENIEILFLSNMVEFKGPFLLLEAFSSLLKRVDISGRIHLRFVGDWQDENFRRKFDTYIKENGLQEHVEILGGIYGDDKNEYFRDADIFVLPTKFEAFPLVLLEAMEFSLPVVSTKEGAISDIVDHGRTGFLIEKNSKVALVEALAVLLTNPNLRKRFGRLGHVKFKNNYTADVLEKNINSVLERITCG